MKQSPLELIATTAVNLLAAKRLTRLIVDDAILEDARQIVWNKYPPESNKLGYLITCHACTSVWTSALISTRLVPRDIRRTLALSEAVLLLQGLEDRLKR